jgi:hypothetical protein
MKFRRRTAKQAEAARRNGAQSRGPITPEGKAASSRNALKHGITTRDVVLHTENPAVFAQYRQIFLDKFQPADPYELDLTEQLAGIAWRLRRAESTETALLDIHVAKIAPEIKDNHPGADIPAAWALAITRLSDESNSLLNIEHMQRRLSRQYARVRAELDLIQGKKQGKKWENEPGGE